MVERVPVAPGVMPTIACTAESPYYAVLLTSLRTDGDRGYGVMTARMLEPPAERQDGFLVVESACADVAHQEAQRPGRHVRFSPYRVRTAKVERAYGL